jgi:hypothetical protein
MTMNQSEERLNFLLENLYIGTGAVTIGIIDKKGSTVAECGRLDVDIVKKLIMDISGLDSSLLQTYWGKQQDSMIHIIIGETGSALFTQISSTMLILCLYPKGVDLIMIYKELNKYITDIRNLIWELQVNETR